MLQNHLPCSYNDITIDSQKIDDDYLRLKQIEEEFNEAEVETEIEQNANKIVIDITPDNVTDIEPDPEPEQEPSEECEQEQEQEDSEPQQLTIDDKEPVLMNLKILASNSAGNCYVLESATGSLLLDCGLPWKEIQKGFNFDISGVIGCLVSHSHNDHSKAVLHVMSAGIYVYMSEGTQQDLKLSEGHRLVNMFPMQQTKIGDFIILPFMTEHDCTEPLGFLIQYRQTGEKLLYLTDSYYCKFRFKGLNYILIECNYIKEILDANIEAGLVDEGMKRRLLESHFSLDHVKDFLRTNDLSQCSKIILIHLSDGNSNAARMAREIQELTGIETIAAEPGLEIGLELYHISTP